MSEGWELAARAVLVGSGATLATDLWARLLKYAFGIPPPDWRMVGRWFGHMPGGRFAHRSMARAAPVRGEHPPGRRRTGDRAHHRTVDRIQRRPRYQRHAGTGRGERDDRPEVVRAVPDPGREPGVLAGQGDDVVARVAR